MTEHTRLLALQFAADGDGHSVAYPVADTLIAEGLLDANKRITDSGRAALARLKGGAR